MLNPFPELLYISQFFAPLLIRLAVGLLFVYTGYMQWKNRHVIAHMRFPIIGRGVWIAWWFVLFHVVIGGMLVVGLYTQIAALLGIAGSVKGLIYNWRYPNFVILPNSTVILAIVMLLSLLLTGAGAFAFDLPL